MRADFFLKKDGRHRRASSRFTCSSRKATLVLLVFLYSSPFTNCSGLMARLGASRASEPRPRRQEAVRGCCGCQRWFPHPSATRQPPRQDAHADETSLFHRSLRTSDSSVATGYLAGLFFMSVTSGEFVLCRPESRGGNKKKKAACLQ